MNLRATRKLKNLKKFERNFFNLKLGNASLAILK